MKNYFKKLGVVIGMMIALGAVGYGGYKYLQWVSQIDSDLWNVVAIFLPLSFIVALFPIDKD